MSCGLIATAVLIMILDRGCGKSSAERCRCHPVREDLDVLIDGRNGLPLPPKRPEPLAHAMVRVMDLPQEERLRMGKAGRRHVEANYSLDRIVDQWEALYRELLARKGVRFE